MSENLIITIGREYGSGGHEIGKKLAERLGINCYDKEILAVSAKKSGFSEQFLEENDESAQNSLLYSLVTGIGHARTQPLSVQLYLEQFNAMKEIAAKESSVFVGRCADYILREEKDLVTVFTMAPLDARIARICERNGVDMAEAERMIQKKDKSRASYYNYYSDKTWGKANTYKLCLDTSETGIDGAVELIARYVELHKSYLR